VTAARPGPPLSVSNPELSAIWQYLKVLHRPERHGTFAVVALQISTGDAPDQIFPRRASLSP